MNYEKDNKNNINIDISHISVDDIPDVALQIMDIIPDSRIVGGWVRDKIWQKAHNVSSCVELYDNQGSCSDIDIATSTLPDDVIKIAKKHKIHVIPIGVEYGTVRLIINGIAYEITTLRLDVECNGRKANVKFGVDWVEDAKRRDFTINAISVDKNGKIYDYFYGVFDIYHKKLRFIGNPAERIKEDYLRIMRYFRFYAKLILSQNSEDNIKNAKNLLDTRCFVENQEIIDIFIENSYGLKNISGERIKSEMFKIFDIDLSETSFIILINLMMKCDIMKYICINDDNDLENGANMWNFQYYLDNCNVFLQNWEEILEKLRIFELNNYIAKDNLDNVERCVFFCAKMIVYILYHDISHNMSQIRHYKHKIYDELEKKILESIICRWRLSNAESKILYDIMHNISAIFNKNDRLKYAYKIGLSKYLLWLAISLGKIYLLYDKDDFFDIHDISDPHKMFIQFSSEALFIKNNVFPVKGRDFLQVGFSGPKIGQSISYAEEIWLLSDGKMTKDEIVDFVILKTK